MPGVSFTVVVAGRTLLFSCAPSVLALGSGFFSDLTWNVPSTRVPPPPCPKRLPAPCSVLKGTSPFFFFSLAVNENEAYLGAAPSGRLSRRTQYNPPKHEPGVIKKFPAVS